MSGQNNNRVHTPETETSLVDSQVDLFCQTPTASPEAFSELQHDMELAFERSLREQGGPKAQERLGSTQSTPIPSSEQRIENPLAEQGPQAMVQKREGKRAVAATPAQEQAQTRDLQQEGPQAMVQKNKKELDDVKDPDVAGSAIKNEKGFSEDQLAYFAGLQAQGTAVKGKEKKRSGMSQTPFFFPETPETDPPTKEPSWSEMVEREEENLRQSDTRRGKTGGRGEGPEDSDDDDDNKDLPKKGHGDKGDPQGSGGGGGSGGFGDDFGGDGPGDGGGCCLLLRRLCVGKSELLVGRSECGAKNLMLIVLQNQRSRLLYLAEHGLNSPADSDRNSNGKHFPNGNSGNV